MIGLLLLVFVRKVDMRYVTNGESGYTRTGFKGYWVLIFVLIFHAPLFYSLGHHYIRTCCPRYFILLFLFSTDFCSLHISSNFFSSDFLSSNFLSFPLSSSPPTSSLLTSSSRTSSPLSSSPLTSSLLTSSPLTTSSPLL